MDKARIKTIVTTNVGIVFKIQRWLTNLKNVEITCNGALTIVMTVMIVGVKKMKVCAISRNSAKLNVVMIGVTQSAQGVVTD